MDKSKARSSIGVLRGVDEQTKLEYEFVKPIFMKEGLTANEFLRLVFSKILIEGSLDFLKETPTVHTSHQTSQPVHQTNPQYITQREVPQLNTQFVVPPINPQPINMIPTQNNQEVQELKHRLDNFISVTSEEFNMLKQNMVTITNLLRKQMQNETSPKRLSKAQVSNQNNSTYNQLNYNDTMSNNTRSNLPINELFKERFNGASIPDYHVVLKDGRGKNSNSVFVQTPDTPKPTYVMQEFISAYNVEFRSIVGKYIQNDNLVSILSVDDSKLLNYIRQRYQTIGDMETYITLCDTQLFNLTLPEIENLLMNLTPYQFVISKPSVIASSKTGEVEKYPIGSPESRFKSAFLQDFDVCWTNDITEFETI